MKKKRKQKSSPDGQSDTNSELVFRRLGKVFERNGVVVRRERLCSGPAFNVKSGNCLFSGKNIIFIDKRLPADQQLGLLYDQFSQSRFDLLEEDLEGLNEIIREKLLTRNPGI